MVSLSRYPKYGINSVIDLHLIKVVNVLCNWIGGEDDCLLTHLQCY